MDETTEKYIDYAISFSTPVEADFLTSGQQQQMIAEHEKFQKSTEFVSAVIGKDDFEERINKAVVEGKIYSSSQMDVIREKLAAVEDMSGTRVDVYETLVNKSGQRIIMSKRLADILGFFGDGYMLKDEADQLVSALEADAVPGPEIDKVVSAMNKYGAVVLQNGVFLVLKNLLEEAIGRNLRTFNPEAGNAPAPTAQPVPAASGDQTELPYSFIEYLKNADKEYDRVENEVIKDPVFLEFFNALKQKYDYYRTMPAERMAGELMVRPRLWTKLSAQTKVRVHNIVERNRDGFNAKIRQVASVSHAEKLDELKRNLGK